MTTGIVWLKEQKFCYKLSTKNGISSAQEKKLISHLEVNNYVYARDIGLYIEKQYGVSYQTLAQIRF